MADDFIGSIAQEDVDFITSIITTTSPGDNYKHLAIYVEDTRFISNTSVFTSIGTTGVSMAELTSNNYTNIVTGVLLTWLSDYFANGIENVYVVRVGANITVEADYTAVALTTAFNLTHQLAYFKTVLIEADDTITTHVVVPAAAAALSTLCGTDTLLSGAPLLPYETTTPETPSSDVLYTAVKAVGDAFFVAYQPVVVDTTTIHHNGGLVALGLSLSVVNNSGIYVGNSFDMVKTDVVSASGANGVYLTDTQQTALKAVNVAYFKYVGDTSGYVALRGASTILGKVVPAYWIVAYANYINKVRVASYITTMNTFNNAVTYANILSIMNNTLSLFIASGRLTNYSNTAPSFANLPKSDSTGTITVPNAWSANFVDSVRTVRVYGTLTI
jgi:hypothetical protein